MKQRFPGVDICVDLSKDKAQTLMDEQDTAVTYQERHPSLSPGPPSLTIK